MLAIDRKHLDVFLSRGTHHDLSRHHENFLARHRQILPRLNRRQRGPQPTRSDDCHQHHFGIVETRDLNQSPFARENLRFVFEQAAQFADLRFIHQTDRFRPNGIRLRRQFSRVAVRGETDDLHPLRDIVGHFQRAFTDRSGRAENDNAFTFHLDRMNKMDRMFPWKKLRAKRFCSFFHCDNSVHSVRNPLLRDADDETQIKEKERRGEEQAVDEIESAANSRQKISGILHAGAAFHNRFREIADDSGEAKQ